MNGSGGDRIRTDTHHFSSVFGVSSAFETMRRGEEETGEREDGSEVGLTAD